jgi:hypothetical protein
MDHGPSLIFSAWIAFVITMISVSIIKLNETKPARTSSLFLPSALPLAHCRPCFNLDICQNVKLIIVMQFLAAILFAGSQNVFFLASEPLCNVSYLPLFDISYREKQWDKLMNRHRKGRSIVPSYVLYYRLLVW